MKRFLPALVLALALAIPAAPASAAGSRPATHVESVTAYAVGDKVAVDVIVTHPGDGAAKLSRGATNLGDAKITVRTADGTVIATETDTERLLRPRPKPRPRPTRPKEVVAAYQLLLDQSRQQAQTALDALRVTVEARGRLDPDGAAGPIDPIVTTDTQTTDVDVVTSGTVPHYVDIRFGTGAACDVDGDDCGAYFDFRSLPGPFHDETGRVRIQPEAGRTTIRFSTSGSQFLEGFVSSLASDRYEITNGIVVPWGIGKITSAPRTDGTPGKVGGPLALDVEREFGGKHDWHVWGYVNIAVSDAG